MAGFPQRNQLVGTHVWTGNARQDAQSSQDAFDTLALLVNQLRNGGVIDGAITLAKLAALTGLSVIGNATNASGTPTAITAGSDGHILRRNGSTLGFGKILTNFITGTGTNDNATAGDIGEYVESLVAAGAVGSWSTGTAKDVASIPLTAGDWDVTGQVFFSNTSATAVTRIAAGINTTSATLPGVGPSRGQLTSAVLSPNGVGVPVGTARFSLSATTTVYLVGIIDFAAGTPSAGGFINARRVR